MRARAWIWLGVMAGCLSGCQFWPSEYLLVTGAANSRHHQVGQKLAQVLAQKSNYRFRIDTAGAGSISNCQGLLAQGHGFALAQNDVPLPKTTGELRSVMPLYPQIFFMVYADSLRPSSLRDLIRGRTIAIGPKSGGTAPFARRLLSRFGIDSTEYNFFYSDYTQNTLRPETPISISVTAYNNSRIADMLTEKGGKIWSFDDPGQLGQGTSVEGFCLGYPFARPFILPKNTFGASPTEPVLTIALENVLLAHRQVPASAVYEITKVLFEHRELLVRQDASLQYLRPDFEQGNLQFPLHEGAKQYLNRDKPSVLERYAEVLALIITLLTLAAGTGATVWQWNRRRRKERIDRYYLDVIQIEKSLPQCQTLAELRAAQTALEQLRQRAFQLLTDEKLQADDSFRIFVSLVQDVYREVESLIQQKNEASREKNLFALLFLDWQIPAPLSALTSLSLKSQYNTAKTYK
ncbi:MAG: hypothetical protein HC913_22545, partial [Microscillaceae bacterium]|nr:hypothetical protein [Microscillaceae bacterium]